MKLKFNSDRTKLTVTASGAERRELKTLGDEIHADATLHEWFEQLISNSDLDWIDPSETGDLTSAPMLAIRFHDNETETYAVLERWAFMDYQVRSVLEDLRDRGEAVFTGGAI